MSTPFPPPLTMPRHRNGRPAAFRAGLLLELVSFAVVFAPKWALFWIVLADGRYGKARAITGRGSGTFGQGV